MNNFLILSCNSNLGSCCQSKLMETILAPVSNILSIIQIVVPILLLLMVIVDLTKLMINPDDKKLSSSIKNKFIATVIIFFIPLFINVTLNLVSSSSTKTFDLAACLKESKNIKVDSKVTYQKTSDKERKSILPDADGYEVGNSNSSGKCKIGDNKVKLVKDFSKGKASLTGKAKGEEVAAYAKTWVGTMSYTQKTPREAALKVGGTCDCSHFVYQVLKHFGLMDHWIKSTVWGSCGVGGTTLYSNKSRLVPGDVLAWGFNDGSGHVEIYIGNGQSVGCNGGRGVVLHSTDQYHVAVHINAYD